MGLVSKFRALRWQTVRGALPTLRANWPWVLTTVVLTAAVAAVAIVPQVQTLSQLGDFFSGFAATLAFIWLVAAYRLQAQELRLQRSELTLQREAIQNQRDEWRRMSRYAALEQAGRILDQFEQSLARNSENQPRSIGDLPQAFYTGMGDSWKVILESNDTQAVFDAYTRWMPIEASCEEFLNRLVSAIELYEEATSGRVIPKDGSAAERLYFSSNDVLAIPFIRHHVGNAKAVATSLFLFQPGRDKIRLRGLEALNTLSPGLVKEDGLAKLRATVEEREAQQK